MLDRHLTYQQFTLAILPDRYRQRARRMIDALAAKPRPAEAKELRSRPGMYRLWLNDWRIIYQVDDEAGAALVIGFRRRPGHVGRQPAAPGRRGRRPDSCGDGRGSGAAGGPAAAPAGRN